MYDDNDAGGGGCLTVLIIAAILAWISDNWVTIVLVIAGIIGLVALILGIRAYQAKKPEREAAARVLPMLSLENYLPKRMRISAGKYWISSISICLSLQRSLKQRSTAVLMLMTHSGDLLRP